MEFRANSGGNLPGAAHEYWQDAVRPADGLSALDYFRPNRRATWRRSLHEVACLHRAIPGDGVCPTDLSRESARYPSVSVGAGDQTLPYGLPAQNKTLDAGRRQRISGLAYSCRVRPVPDRASAQTLRGRQLWYRVGEHRLRAGFDDDRSVPVALSVGVVSYDEICGENAHTAGFTRQYSQLHSPLRRQVGRRQCPRHSDVRVGSNLRHGEPAPRSALGTGAIWISNGFTRGIKRTLFLSPAPNQTPGSSAFIRLG